MKSLAEWIKVDIGSTGEDDAEQAVPHTDLLVDNMAAAWGGIAYAELSIVLVHLRYLAFVHQTHHWIAKGDPFYADHQMFERLYNGTVKEIDAVAEKAVGLGNEQNVNLALQVSQLQQLCKAYGSPQTVPQSSELARASLVAECNFLKILKACCESMRSQGIETPGVENLLHGIADAHEGYVYLLKRRCAQGALGF